ncbi:hypothetical protein E5D57_013647 [Metarhizium anisopliae]|nr:hypothetical protein E5D57_013647 [Metarhizium anisopliae]
MSPSQQQLKWKTQTVASPRKGQTIASHAVERVKRGDSVKNDTHVRKLVKDTAEARYCRQGNLKDITLGAVVTLSLSFTAAEWAAVKREPTLLQETLDYFKTGDFQIDRWWTYWRNLQLEEPKLAKLFLLGI